MNPFLTWFADHLGAALVGGLAIAVVTLLFAAVAAWRTAKRLLAPPRPVIRFALSLILLLASAGAAVFFTTGLVKIGPGVWAQREMLGEPVPELEFAYVDDGAPARLADFRGQVVLLNVWATWCPPCVAEADELDRLQETYAGKGLVVLHLSDEDREKLRAWLEERPTATVHLYAQPIPWPETGRPTTYVIDREGRLRRVMLGQRSYEQFAAAVERHL